MLLNYPCCSKIKRGDVFDFKKQLEVIPGEKGLNKSRGHVNGRCVVVQHDDLIPVRGLVMVCPITRAKEELEGQSAIGKVQYIYNGVMYTIHCDEVQPIDKRFLTERLFSLSSSVIDNCVVEIDRMLTPGSCLELDLLEVAEDSANRNEDVVDVTPPSLNNHDLTEPVTALGKAIRAAAPGPLPANRGIVPAPKTIVIHEKRKYAKYPPNFLKIWESQDREQREDFCQAIGATYHAAEEKYRKMTTGSWSEDTKTEFVVDYEKMEEGVISPSELLKKYKIKSMQGATKKYASILK